MSENTRTTTPIVEPGLTIKRGLERPVKAYAWATGGVSPLVPASIFQGVFDEYAQGVRKARSEKRRPRWSVKAVKCFDSEVAIAFGPQGSELSEGWKHIHRTVNRVLSGERPRVREVGAA